MKKFSENSFIIHLRIGIVTLVLVSVSAFLFSFSGAKATGDFFKELGITKTEADKKIFSSLLIGYLDQSGVRNAKNILIGNRSAVAKDLLTYTKKQASSPDFIKEYNAMRENYKPKPATVETPEEMQKNTIALYKKSVADMEVSLKKADASMKPIFENVLAEGKKQLKEVEDPNNKTFANYKKNYPELVKATEASNQRQLAEWEKKYPVNHLLFIKTRLQTFLEETKDIDFDAELFEKNGKKYFTNKDYERKGNRWKLAYRAGRQVVEPARAFVQEWIAEIN
jgi:hypothetical protein